MNEAFYLIKQTIVLIYPVVDAGVIDTLSLPGSPVSPMEHGVG